MSFQKNIGLYGKFNVSRKDGRDQPGGDRENTTYFVLDVIHDPFAKPALAAYASSCMSDYPKLADDLVQQYGLHPAKLTKESDHNNIEESAVSAELHPISDNETWIAANRLHKLLVRCAQIIGMEDGGLLRDLPALLERKLQSQPTQAPDGWRDIDSGPKGGRTILLGYFNSHGKWRTMRGQWFTKKYIDDNWEDGDLFAAGWYETSVEADDAPSCWPTNPTHWMPLPAAPQPKGGE